MLTIPLSEDVEARLRAQAAAAGQDPGTYAAGLIERLTRTPRTLRDISGPLTDEFATLGMTDDELGDMLEQVKHEMRRTRRAGS